VRTLGTCTSLEEVRANIDAIDREIVQLFVERGHFVSQAARFKKNSDDVRAPDRVEQVIAKVRKLSEDLGANPEVTEAAYRALISAFIDAEMAEHARRDPRAQ
jgi:isochorismate pyruvate lyase